MHEKPPGEALIEMEALEPGTPRRPNAAAAGAITAGIIAGVLGALLLASKQIDPLPPPWWYALLVVSGMTTLLALLGYAKSTAAETAGRKRSLFGLVLGLGGIAVAFLAGSSAFFPKPPPTPPPVPAPRRVGTASTRRAATRAAATTRTAAATRAVGATTAAGATGAARAGTSTAPVVDEP